MGLAALHARVVWCGCVAFCAHMPRSDTAGSQPLGVLLWGGCTLALAAAVLAPHVGVGSVAGRLNHPHVTTVPWGGNLLLEGPQQKLSYHSARPTTQPLSCPWGSAPGCLSELWQACPGRARVSSGAGGLDRTVVSDLQWWPVPWNLQGCEGSESVVQVLAGDVHGGSQYLSCLCSCWEVGLKIPAAREDQVWAPDLPQGVS